MQVQNTFYLNYLWMFQFHCIMSALVSTYITWNHLACHFIFKFTYHEIILFAYCVVISSWGQVSHICAYKLLRILDYLRQLFFITNFTIFKTKAFSWFNLEKNSVLKNRQGKIKNFVIDICRIKLTIIVKFWQIKICLKCFLLFFIDLFFSRVCFGINRKIQCIYKRIMFALDQNFSAENVYWSIQNIFNFISKQ